MNEEKDYKVISVSKSAFKGFQKIKEMTFFKKLENKENKNLFLLAMALGFKYNDYKPIKSGNRHPGGFFRVETLAEKEKSIIKAIAIYHQKNDISILSNPKAYYQIAENYANAGLSKLKTIISEKGDFFINLAKKCE